MHAGNEMRQGAGRRQKYAEGARDRQDGAGNLSSFAGGEVPVGLAATLRFGRRHRLASPVASGPESTGKEYYNSLDKAVIQE